MEGFKLPESFVNNMGKLLGSELDTFVNCYNEPHRAGIRINTLKTSPTEFMKISPVGISKIKWIPNGFYYDEKEQPAKHPYYYAGVYYIQEPSAMTPASLLPVFPGARVLDLCAAPGGKTTELGARLAGSGVLVTNDISNSRAKALLKNVELFGIKNAVVISESPAKLSTRFEEWFDCILVDAPCSGEGMFRKSHAIIKNWEQYGTSYYAQLQREILPNAIKMLRPGGYLLYSTCTFSPEEDENTLAFICDTFPDMEIVPAIDFDDEKYEGFERGLPIYAGGRKEAEYALRLYPHKVKGEGHFVALLRKNDGKSGNEADRKEEIPDTAPEDVSGQVFQNLYPPAVRKKTGLPDELFDFLEKTGFEIPAQRLFEKDGRVYMIPEGLPEMKGLRILRSGLLLGEVRKGRFEPSQALACALKADEYPVTLKLEPDSSDVYRYLKCESIGIPDDLPDGYVLVCCGRFPLGWGKASGGRLKNKYLPGWRML